MKRILSAVVLGFLMVPGTWGESETVLYPKCAELPGTYPDVSGDRHAFAQCWQELDEQPGCYVYRDHYHTNDYIDGTAKCSDGLIKRGTLTIESAAGDVFEGRFIDGKMNGLWVHRYSNGYIGQGSIVDGKREGLWRYSPPDKKTRKTCWSANEIVECEKDLFGIPLLR